MLEYESSTLGDFAKFSRSLKGPVHVNIWIDADTGLLAKGELAAWNTEPPGSKAPFELDQVFAGYGLDIQISAPQVGGTLTPRAELMTVQDVGNFMQTYYLDPRTELIGNLIEALQRTGYLQKRTNLPGTLGFFSEIFPLNSNQLAQWQALITKQDEQTKMVLTQALSVSESGGVLSFNSHSPQLNDEGWGAFFASGNTEFIQRLLDQL